ncbi:PAS domain S-box protein [bacterium]|nr:PAS domain S-box protein [bacterium]
MITDSEDKFLTYGGYMHSEQETFTLLRSFVDAIGGDAAVLALYSGRGQGNSAVYRVGLDRFPDENITALVQEAADEFDYSTGGGSGGFSGLRRLQRRLTAEAERLKLKRRYVLVMPVMLENQICGLFAMLHRQDLPSFLRRYPQMYNLVLDRLELTVRHAGLLSNLMRERSWFETLVKRSNDGIAIVDKDGTVVGINQAMEALSGWSVEEAAGKPLYKLFPIKAFGFSENAESGSARNLILYNKPSQVNFSISGEPVEGVLTVRDGRSIDIEVTGLTIRDASGIPSGWVMTVRDISRRKETERLGKIFLSAMSHELQTPIAVIKGFAGLMSDPEIELDRQTVLQKSQVILDESERLQKMVRQMLEAASIQAGGISLSCEQVDLVGVAERTARRLEHLAQEKKLALRVEAEANIKPVWGDLPKLEQVMSNLVENAVKYSNEGIIIVRIKNQSESVKVFVDDEGPGISEEDSQRIFAPFERGEETKKKTRGSGLGLFISKAIIEAHKGSIGVVNSGKGACFYFTLPCRKD